MSPISAADARKDSALPSPKHASKEGEGEGKAWCEPTRQGELEKEENSSAITPSKKCAAKTITPGSSKKRAADTTTPKSGKKRAADSTATPKSNKKRAVTTQTTPGSSKKRAADSTTTPGSSKKRKTLQSKFEAEPQVIIKREPGLFDPKRPYLTTAFKPKLEEGAEEKEKEACKENEVVNTPVPLPTQKNTTPPPSTIEASTTAAASPATAKSPSKVPTPPATQKDSTTSAPTPAPPTEAQLLAHRLLPMLPYGPWVVCLRTEPGHPPYTHEMRVEIHREIGRFRSMVETYVLLPEEYDRLHPDILGRYRGAGEGGW